MKITEEFVTKAILNWLKNNGWTIICFDFPQSGTGVLLHPNEEIRTTKNKGAFIPDIVAIKNGKVIFFENKDRFVFIDFVKIQNLKQGNGYFTSIKSFLKDFSYSTILYGVGIAKTKNSEIKTIENLDKIDFAIICNENKTIKVIFDNYNIFN